MSEQNTGSPIAASEVNPGDVAAMAEAAAAAGLFDEPSTEAPKQAPKAKAEASEVPKDPPAEVDPEYDDDLEDVDLEDDESPAPADEDPDGEEGAVYKVKVDGQEVEVSLDELKAGYQRHASFTKKTQALAEERKTFETERKGFEERSGSLPKMIEAIEAKGREYDAYLGQIQAALNADGEKYRDPEFIAKARQDPSLMADLLEYQARQQTATAHMAERERMRAAYEEQQRKEAVTKLRQHFDSSFGWSDETRRKREIPLIEATAKDFGFSDDELRAVTDPRQWSVLRDATFWREAKRKSAERKAAAAPGDPIVVDKVGRARPAGGVLRKAARANEHRQAVQSGDVTAMAAAAERAGLI